jgi:hypothetical protein
MNGTKRNWWCVFGIHTDKKLEPLGPVEWIGGAAGARPFQEFRVQCERCGRKSATLYRSEGQGLIP